jgi:DNA-binding NarL/FixJ family response regulator
MNIHIPENKKQAYKVFIVDDHPVMREGLSELVNHEKDLTVCCEAGDIPDALQAITDCKPNIAIVDLALKRNSGIILIEKLLNSYPSLPILVYSMYDELIYAQRCLKIGAQGYIMKHESSKEIISALKKILTGEVYISRNLTDKFINKMIGSEIENHNSPTELLGNRELEVYLLLGHGNKRKEIAEQLNISKKTIDNHIDHIKNKMKFKDTNELRMRAFKFVTNGR